jgi:hypothetical protein
MINQDHAKEEGNGPNQSYAAPIKIMAINIRKIVAKKERLNITERI